MKKVFKISVAVMLFVQVLTLPALAQERPPHPPMLPDSVRIEKMVDELARELSLSAAQKQKIRDLHFAHFAKVKAMLEKNREEQRKRMEVSRKEFEKQITSELSKKQAEEFVRFTETHRGPHPEKPGVPKE